MNVPLNFEIYFNFQPNIYGEKMFKNNRNELQQQAPGNYPEIRYEDFRLNL